MGKKKFDKKKSVTLSLGAVPRTADSGTTEATDVLSQLRAQAAEVRQEHSSHTGGSKGDNIHSQQHNGCAITPASAAEIIELTPKQRFFLQANMQKAERISNAFIELDQAACKATLIPRGDRVSGSGGGAGPAAARAAARALRRLLEENDTAEMELDPSAVSMVIGKGGATIQKIEAETGAQLRMARDEGFGSTARQRAVLRLRGEAAQIDAARAAIQAIVDDVVHPLEISIAAPDISTLIGQGGSTIRRIESESGAKLHLDGKDRAQPRVLRISGTADARETAAALVRALWAGSCEVALPIDPATGRSCSSGIVIGHGGATIKEIQQASGARLDVDDQRSVVRLRGSVESVQNAKRALQDLFEKHSLIGVDGSGSGGRGRGRARGRGHSSGSGSGRGGGRGRGCGGNSDASTAASAPSLRRSVLSKGSMDEDDEMSIKSTLSLADHLPGLVTLFDSNDSRGGQRARGGRVLDSGSGGSTTNEYRKLAAASSRGRECGHRDHDRQLRGAAGTFGAQSTGHGRGRGRGRGTRAHALEGQRLPRSSHISPGHAECHSLDRGTMQQQSHRSHSQGTSQPPRPGTSSFSLATEEDLDKFCTPQLSLSEQRERLMHRQHQRDLSCRPQVVPSVAPQGRPHQKQHGRGQQRHRKNKQPPPQPPGAVATPASGSTSFVPHSFLSQMVAGIDATQAQAQAQPRRGHKAKASVVATAICDAEKLRAENEALRAELAALKKASNRT
eukprot:g2931.t1